jgi:hypothetical protein
VAPGAWHARLSASRCILPPIQAALAAAPIRLADCIVDGAGLELTGCGPAPAPPARRAAVDRPAAAATGLAPGLEATGVTFAGPVHTETVAADDCVFVDGVDAVHVQAGHLRHCHLGPPGSSPAVPATYRCLTAPAPAFESTAFEAGAYYALALDPDQPLLHAASDGGEVGAYHHARRATALGRLRDRIHEFVPLGLRARVELAPWEESRPRVEPQHRCRHALRAAARLRCHRDIGRRAR